MPVVKLEAAPEARSLTDEGLWCYSPNPILLETAIMDPETSWNQPGSGVERRMLTLHGI